MFYFTRHALEKMDGFGLYRNEIEQVIRKGMKWKEERSDKWHAQMAGIEAVFMKEEEKIVIITVYAARREK